MRPLALALGLVLALPQMAAAQENLSGEPASAGTYQLDPAHARLLVRVNHLGFSNYTALIQKFDATLTYDPANPQAMTVSATVDPASIETHYPDPGFDFNALLTGPEFLDVARFPDASFRSTAVRLTGDRTAEVTGDLTLHGVTRPVSKRPA